MTGHRLFASEPIGNLFLSARGNIWNSKEVFYNKTTSCWGADVSIEIYELLLLFSIITPWVNTNFQIPIFLEHCCTIFGAFKKMIETYTNFFQGLLIWGELARLRGLARLGEVILIPRSHGIFYFTAKSLLRHCKRFFWSRGF